jgi:hypothetical protein
MDEPSLNVGRDLGNKAFSQFRAVSDVSRRVAVVFSLYAIAVFDEIEPGAKLIVAFHGSKS